MERKNSSQASLILATTMALVLFCGMQMQRQWLASTQLRTIFGGYLGSLLFILLLTAIGNMETIVFGSRFHTRLFPEVVLCLSMALLAAGMIHRVCITSCFLLSIVGLYYMNKISKKVHPVQAPVAPPITKKKK